MHFKVRLNFSKCWAALIQGTVGTSTVFHIFSSRPSLAHKGSGSRAHSCALCSPEVTGTNPRAHPTSSNRKKKLWRWSAVEFLWSSISLLISPSCSGKACRNCQVKTAESKGVGQIRRNIFLFSPLLQCQYLLVPPTRQKVHGDLGRCLCPEAVAGLSPVVSSQGEALP